MKNEFQNITYLKNTVIIFLTLIKYRNSYKESVIRFTSACKNDKSLSRIKYYANSNNKDEYDVNKGSRIYF